MAGAAFKSKPKLPDELIARWPPPEQLSPNLDWGSMTYDQREHWLIRHAYEETDDGWTPRSNLAGDETAQRVVQAVTTVSGVDTMLSEVYQETVTPAISAWNKSGPSNPRTDQPQADHHPIMVWLFLIFVLLLVIVVAALITDMFGTRGESDTEPPVSAQVVEAQGEEDLPAPAVGPPPGAEAPAVIEQPAEPDPETITYSSVPDHVRYAKSWSDGEIGITLNPDGTYRYVAAGVDNTGNFKMTAEDGVDRILFLDPDDPSGLYVTSQLAVSIEDGMLVYGQGESARRLAEVAELPEMAIVYPPAQRVVFAEGSTEYGSWRTEHAGMRPVYRADIRPDSASGSLDIDVEGDTFTGQATVAFSCEGGTCPNTDLVSGTATATMTAATRTEGPSVWEYVGTAEVDLAWTAETECETGVCTWPYTVTVPMEFELRLHEPAETVYWVLEADGTAGSDVGYSFSVQLDSTIRHLVTRANVAQGRIGNVSGCRGRWVDAARGLSGARPGWGESAQVRDQSFGDLIRRRRGRIRDHVVLHTVVHDARLETSDVEPAVAAGRFASNGDLDVATNLDPAHVRALQRRPPAVLVTRTLEEHLVDDQVGARLDERTHGYPPAIMRMAPPRTDRDHAIGGNRVAVSRAVRPPRDSADQGVDPEHEPPAVELLLHRPGERRLPRRGCSVEQDHAPTSPEPLRSFRTFGRPLGPSTQVNGATPTRRSPPTARSRPLRRCLRTPVSGRYFHRAEPSVIHSASDELGEVERLIKQPVITVARRRPHRGSY